MVPSTVIASASNVPSISTSPDISNSVATILSLNVAAPAALHLPREELVQALRVRDLVGAPVRVAPRARVQASAEEQRVVVVDPVVALVVRAPRLPAHDRLGHVALVGAAAGRHAVEGVVRAVGVAVARTHGAHRAAVNGAHRAADRVADRDFDTGLYNRARQLSREREPWWVVFVWKPSGSI